MPDEPTRETPGFVAFSSPSSPADQVTVNVTNKSRRMEKPINIPGVSLPPSAKPGPSQPLVLTFPGGSKIELGERETIEGRYPFVSLTSPSDPSGLPSLTLWVDPVSFQPMITLRTGPGQYQSYPLDKKFQSPYDKSWSPPVASVSAAHIGVPPTPPQNQVSK